MVPKAAAPAALTSPPVSAAQQQQAVPENALQRSVHLPELSLPACEGCLPRNVSLQRVLPDLIAFESVERIDRGIGWASAI